MDTQKVGRRIQEVRKARGLTQAELPAEEQRRILRVLEVMIDER